MFRSLALGYLPPTERDQDRHKINVVSDLLCVLLFSQYLMSRHIVTSPN